VSQSFVKIEGYEPLSFYYCVNCQHM